jgi:hypothetical protein
MINKKQKTDSTPVEVTYDKLKGDLLIRFGIPFAQEVYRHKVEVSRINAERSVTNWNLPPETLVKDSINITEGLYNYLVSSE